MNDGPFDAIELAATPPGEHLFLFALAGLLLAAGFVTLVVNLRQALKANEKSTLTNFLRENDKIAVAIIVLIVSAIAFVLAAARAPADASFLKTISIAFAATLAQGVILFVFFGLIVLISSRRNKAPTPREATPKQDIAPRPTPPPPAPLPDPFAFDKGERAYVEAQLPRLACTFHHGQLEISVQKCSRRAQYALLDVVETQTLGNRFENRTALFQYRFCAEPGPAPRQMRDNVSTATICSSSTALFNREGDGAVTTVEAETALHAPASLSPGGASFLYRSEDLEIGPGQFREIKTRISGWRRIRTKTGPVAAYDVHITRPWRRFSVAISNVRLTAVSYEIRLNGAAVASGILPPGADEEGANTELGPVGVGDIISVYLLTD